MTKSQSLPRAAVKITGILTAMAVLFCLTAYFGSGYKVSADPPPPTSILRGDVDQNETVGILDLVLLNQFLVGQSNIDPDRADVNTDGVVDADDATALAGHIVKLTQNWWTEEVNVTSMTSANAGNVEYIKHTTTLNYNQTKVNDEEYSLTVATPQTGSGISPLNIVNMNDNRQTYSGEHANAVVQVGVWTNNHIEFTATGFIIDGNKVVTNAHVVYDYDNQLWKPRNAIRTHTGEVYKITYTHIPKEVYNGHKTSGNDYALLKIGAKVNTNITVDLAETYGWFDIGIVTDDRIAQSDEMYNNSTSFNNLAVVGFPEKVDGTLINYSPPNNIPYYDWGTLFDYYSLGYNSIMTYTNFTSRGNSGSPLIYDKDNNHNNENDWIAIGIHSTHNDNENSRGVRFTSKQLKFFFNNTKFNIDT